MSTLNILVRDFLTQSPIAVVGVSDRRETGCNLVYRKLKEAGAVVYPVSPRLKTFDGVACYPDLTSIPETPAAVFILAKPAVTEKIVAECVALGVKHVWMHCMMGTKPGLGKSTTSVSPSAVRLCREHGIAVIPGSCPAQFFHPDLGHSMMRILWGAMGFLKVDEASVATTGS